MAIRNARTRAIIGLVERHRQMKKRGARAKKKRRPTFMAEIKVNPIQQRLEELGIKPEDLR
jgi:hypothetical protein